MINRRTRRSWRCQPCITRHVKCGGRKPTCEQCESSGHSCVWPRAEFKGSQFRCELQYASGKVPRPRGPRKEFEEDGGQEANIHFPAKTNSLALAVRSKSSSPEPSIARTNPTQPLYDFARAKYVRSFLQHQELCSTEHEGFISKFGLCKPESKFCKTLDLALLATALTNFGQTEKSRKALVAGSIVYQQALKTTRQELVKASNLIPDELLLIILLLASCEDKMGNTQDSNQAPSSYQHLEAATELMWNRRDSDNVDPKKLFLENITSRRAIKMSISKGKKAPPILQTWAPHFAHPAERLLYHYMVELSDINADMMNHVAGRPILGPPVPLKTILENAKELDSKMVYIRQLHVKDPRFATTITTVEPVLKVFKSIINRHQPYRHFSSARIAHEVLMYFASHLRTKDIIVNALEWMMEDENGEFDEAREQLLQSSRAGMENLAAEIFEAIPYLFGPAAASARNLHELEKNANALYAAQCIFPLHSVSLAFGTAAVTKNIAKELVLLVSRVNANRILPLVHGPKGPFGKKRIRRVWPKSNSATS